MSYVEDAVKTESPITPELKDRLSSNARLLHGAIGLCTETGEFQDALKRAIFYNKAFDKVNLIEEVGDVMWYLAIICDELGVSFEEVQAKNIAKLKARYPNKFTEVDADVRDLDKEREVLEKVD